MKSQDVIAALILASEHAPSTYAGLGNACGMSTSEAHGSVGRLRACGLVNHQRKVNTTRLLEFLEHGLRFIFPVQPQAFALGLPTGSTRFEGQGLPEPEGGAWVWPSPNGTQRGLSIVPLHRGAVDRVTESPELWDMLALVDLVRAGRARERSWALQALKRRLGGGRWPTAMRPVDPRRPDALRDMFSYTRLRRTISRRLHDPRRDLGATPIARVALAILGEEIVADLHERVPAGGFKPGAAEVLRHRKPSGGEREFSFPGLLDAIVASRIMDELEPLICADSDERTFVNRSRSPSLSMKGDYRAAWFGGWKAFLGSLDAASNEMGMALRTDVRDFYGSIGHTLARQVVAQRTGAVPMVIDLLMECVEAWQGRPSGLAIDSEDVGALIAHAILRNVDDEFPDGPNLTYRRFADDVVMFAPTVEDLHQAKRRFETTLARYQLKVNPRKTDLAAASKIAEHFIDPFHEQLNAHAKDIPQLTTWFSQFANHEPRRQSLARRRHILTLAARREAPSLVSHAVHAFGEPALRGAALDFLATQAIPMDQVRRILRTQLASWSELETVQLADTLARSVLEMKAVEKVSAWAQKRAISCASEAEQARLYFLLFKLDSSVPANWRPQKSAIARVTADLLVAASGGQLEERFQPCSEEILFRRLLSKLRHAEVHAAVLRNVLLTQRRGFWMEPEILPLLHVLHRSEPPWLAHWFDLLMSTDDPILKNHIQRLATS